MNNFDRVLAVIAVVLAIIFLILATVMVRYLTYVPDANKNLESPREITISPTATSTETQASTTLPLIVTDNEPILAEKVVILYPDRSFVIPDIPGVSFRIKRMYRATGGEEIAVCSDQAKIDSKFIYIKNKSDSLLPASTPDGSGFCFNTTKSSLASANTSPSLVIVDLEINNNTNEVVGGKFLNLFYTVPGKEAAGARVATEVPNWQSYGDGVPAKSKKSVFVNFQIPDSQNEVELLYGNYEYSVGASNQESVLGNTVNGFVIDFSKKTFSQIPG